MSNFNLRGALLVSVALAGLACSTAGLAEEAAAAALGTETRGWVDLQKSGSAASAEARPMPGDIADKVYQRYANSFAKPIPDPLGRESFVEGSGGGGSGGE